MMAQKVEERWTPTEIQAAFILPSLSSKAGSGVTSINLPLLNHGLSFTLSLLAPERQRARRPILGSKKSYQPSSSKWIPKAFAFHLSGNAIPWEKTFMRAQLSLQVAAEEHGCEDTGCNHPCHTMVGDSVSLGVIEAVLADTPAAETPISTLPGFLLQSPADITLRLHVSISECPSIGGLFQIITSSCANEAEAHAWLVRQCGDHLLDQSLATGKIYDVKFLTFPNRPTSGNNGKPLETYASLSVLEKHINLTSAKISEGWTNALAALGQPGNPDAIHAGEIVCPNGYEYELDSDFDEDEPLPSVEPRASPPLGQHDPVAFADQQFESRTEILSNSFSSCGLDGASDLGLVDSRLEEFINDPREPSHPSSETANDYRRTISIMFAAPRTWRAFLWYCYNSRLEFSKLKSQVEPGVRHLRAVEYGTPSCSPKSMYRLADLVGDEALKATALEAIRERMTETNVLDELFSVFTSKYSAVREVQLNVLMGQCKSPEVKKAFIRAVLSFGGMPHAKPALEAFFDRLVALNDSNHYSYE